MIINRINDNLIVLTNYHKRIENHGETTRNA